MATNIDMAIEACTALLPFGANVRVTGQRLQRRAIQTFKQIAAAGTEMATDLAIELIQQRPDSGVYLIKPKEPLITQLRQNPALGQQNGTHDLCLVFGFARTSWNNRGVVVAGHIAIDAIDRRSIETGLCDTRLQIVRDHLCGHAAKELKGMHMAGYRWCLETGRNSLAASPSM